jgi:ribonuclease HI
MTITIYTDGACEGNQFKTNVGGWAYLILGLTNEEIKEAGAEKNTTNNKMELTACISALNLVASKVSKNSSNPEIKLFSDSEYVVKGVKEWRKGWERKGWKNSKGEPVKNKELWEQLFSLSDRLSVSFIHVRGHVGDKYNEMVDSMAVGMIRNYKNLKNQ